MSIFELEDEEDEADHSPPGDGQIAWDLTRSVLSCRDFELNGEEYDNVHEMDGKSFEERTAFYQGRIFQRIADNAEVSFRTAGVRGVGPEVERDKHEFTSMREEMAGPAMHEMICETFAFFGPVRDENNR